MANVEPIENVDNVESMENEETIEKVVNVKTIEKVLSSNIPKNLLKRRHAAGYGSTTLPEAAEMLSEAEAQGGRRILVICSGAALSLRHLHTHTHPHSHTYTLSHTNTHTLSHRHSHTRHKSTAFRP